MQSVISKMSGIVENEKDNLKLDFLWDMELGICSCTTGSTGTACRYHAAVAKHCKLVSVNIHPIDSQE